MSCWGAGGGGWGRGQKQGPRRGIRGSLVCPILHFGVEVRGGEVDGRWRGHGDDCRWRNRRRNYARRVATRSTLGQAIPETFQAPIQRSGKTDLGPSLAKHNFIIVPFEAVRNRAISNADTAVKFLPDQPSSSRAMETLVHLIYIHGFQGNIVSLPRSTSPLSSIHSRK